MTSSRSAYISSSLQIISRIIIDPKYLQETKNYNAGDFVFVILRLVNWSHSLLYIVSVSYRTQARVYLKLALFASVAEYHVAPKHRDGKTYILQPS